MIVTLVARILIFIIPITGFHNPGKPDSLKITSLIRYGDLSFSSSRIIKTSPGLFNLLNYDLVAHNSVMMNGFSDGVVLSMRTKIRLFGNSPAVGKIISVDSQPLAIVGVIRDVPERSCLNCDLIILSSKMEMSAEEFTNIRCSIIL